MSVSASTSKFLKKIEGIQIKEWKDKYVDYDKLKQFINDPRNNIILFIFYI